MDSSRHVSPLVANLIRDSCLELSLGVLVHGEHSLSHVDVVTSQQEDHQWKLQG